MKHVETDRVRAATSAEINRRIDLEIENRIIFYARKNKRAITLRLKELDEEWSIERWLETNASSLALTGLVLGATVNKKWLWLSGGVLGFLLLHGLHGWCPPVPALRRMGVRTRGEIERERYALKILRGDFQIVASPEQAHAAPLQVWRAVNV